MTIAAITKIVIDEIDVLSDFNAQQISALYSPPEADPKLSKFMSASLKPFLATNLKRKMRFIKSTDLTNKLFTTVTTIHQLVQTVKSYDKSDT
ncbi:MAG TPA: hypothetical protein VD993_15520 [Chitinophagaceae bacterium]|nr:hypothetical protein [Chitinophagaceae bacterium]